MHFYQFITYFCTFLLLNNSKIPQVPSSARRNLSGKKWSRSSARFMEARVTALCKQSFRQIQTLGTRYFLIFSIIDILFIFYQINLTGGVGFLNSIGAEIRRLQGNKCERNRYFLLFKKPQKYRKCPALSVIANMLFCRVHIDNKKKKRERILGLLILTTDITNILYCNTSYSVITFP